MTNETPTALEKVRNAITNKVTALITAHNEDTSAHGLDNISDLIDVADGVSENDSRPVSSEAVYEEINDINELLMWIMNQDIVVQDNLESTLEELLTEE